MVERFRHVQTRHWVAGLGLLAIAGLLMAGGVAGHAKPQASSQENFAVPVGQPAPAGVSAASGTVAASGRPVNPEAAQHNTNLAKSLSEAFHGAAEKVLPCVVTITNTVGGVEKTKGRSSVPDQGDNAEDDPFQGTPFGELFRNNPELRPFLKGMPSAPRRRVVESGSGVVIDASGVILTNNHVVEGGGKVMVRFPDGREIPAKEIKTDPKTDLAVVRVEGAGSLKAAKLGDSDGMDVGDWVLALGQPFGLEGTVTAGIISAKGRGLGITPRESFLQTDAAINPGNSGGPLVNLDGEVVGINTAISTQSGGYQGVGFAIPINLAKWVSRQLVATGKVQRAYLGVGMQAIDQDLAEKLGVKVHEGVVVNDVFERTPADKAGLKQRDIIVEFAGKKVNSPQELQGMVEESKIGSRRPMVVIRDGKRMTLEVAPDEQPADYGLTRRGARAFGGKPETSRFDKLGLQVETLTPELAKQLDVKAGAGVAITEVRPGSPAQEAGLSSGMVITEANRKPVRSADDFRKAIEQQSLDKGVLLLVQSAKGSRFVVIRVQD